MVFWAARCGRYLCRVLHGLVAKMFRHFLCGKIQCLYLPPGDVEHVGVDWNRARLIEGHEEDAVGNLKENSRFLQ